MRILITGPMGYVGPVAIRHLRARFPDSELIGFDTAFFAQNLTRPRTRPLLLDDIMVIPHRIPQQLITLVEQSAAVGRP